VCFVHMRDVGKLIIKVILLTLLCVRNVIDRFAISVIKLSRMKCILVILRVLVELQVIHLVIYESKFKFEYYKELLYIY
jgi:hypothetical protein